jgi:hypothetical protein
MEAPNETVCTTHYGKLPAAALPETLYQPSVTTKAIMVYKPLRAFISVIPDHI